MGLFSKKKEVETPETRYLNELLLVALTFNQTTGTWEQLPEEVPQDIQNEVIKARKLIFEYIRQLKEAKFYSDSAVRKFAKETFPWINKQNVDECILLGKNL